GAAGVQNTLFNGNLGSALTFPWLVHLNRPPVNPVELVHVSGCMAHELTQKFNGNFGHYAPWTDANSLIYRLLDSAGSHYQVGFANGGRYQGNVNLNTLMEPEIFRALCDAHDVNGLQYPNPWFNQTDVDTVFSRIQNSRGVSSSAAPTTEGNPFRTFSAART